MIRRLLHEIFPALWLISAAIIGHANLRLVTNCSDYVMVVSSESMEPALYRGDLIFLWNREEQVHAGDIPVVWFDGRELPMVHRAIEVHHEIDTNCTHAILTKGDNNLFDDVVLYPVGRNHVYREEVKGSVRGYVPFIGHLILFVKSWIVL
ncbi:putative signal peptidase I [Lophiostoma macrostomum CBS 122681]|uniref:Signal peptidase complex catalytic subunit SEC11 n=1 Tax=Lophiostoma macrostomum CBS 122681 TaxID=1314788 RepID=A0A6A6SLW3_9PLEO|nr:putative signal peptidase I [Lophiostoma macrostomum CBS 122681]